MSSAVTFEPDGGLQWKLNGCKEIMSQKDSRRKIVDELKHITKNGIGIEGTQEGGYKNPTTLELALCSSEAYQSYHADPNKKSVKWKKLDTGWRWLCSVENEMNKYFGIAFMDVRNKSPRVMIAHRGTTVDWKVLLADITGILENKLTPQINSACTFALTMVDAIREIREEGVYVQLSITGHSLGGWLAQISTFAVKHLHIQTEITTGKYFKRNEESGYHAHCEVFDSPGVKQILQRINREIVGGDEFLYKLDITVYTIVPNVVNTVNEHLGDQIVFFLENSTKFWKKAEKLNLSNTSGFSKFLEMSKTAHELEKFIEELKSENSSKRRLALSWPLVLVRNWSHNSSTNEPGIVSALYKIASTPFRHFLLANTDLVLGELRDVFIRQSSSKYFQTVELSNQRINLNIFSEREANFIVDLFHWNKYNSIDAIQNNLELKTILQAYDGMILKPREIFLPQHLEKDSFISDVRRYVWNQLQENSLCRTLETNSALVRKEESALTRVTP